MGLYIFIQYIYVYIYIYICIHGLPVKYVYRSREKVLLLPLARAAARSACREIFCTHEVYVYIGIFLNRGAFRYRLLSWTSKKVGCPIGGLYELYTCL